MATTLASNVAWGSAPINYLTFQYDKSRSGTTQKYKLYVSLAPCSGGSYYYDKSRSGTTQKYKLYVSLAPCSGGSYYGYAITLDISLDGEKLLSGVTLKAASPSQWTSAITYTSGWLNVEDKTSGTTALKIRVYSSGVSGRDKTYSYSLPLDITASEVSATDAYIGSTGTILIDNHGNSALNHTLAYSADEGVSYTTIATGVTAASYGWTVPTAFYSLIPNYTLLAVSIRCQTYSGTTLIGTTYGDMVAHVKKSDNLPDVSLAAADTRTPTVHLTGDSKKIIRRHSTLTVSAKASAKNKASVSRVVLSGGDSSMTVDPLHSLQYSFPDVSDATAGAVVTDSRGYYTYKEAEGLTAVDYQAPTVTPVAERAAPTSDTVNISVSGDWFNGSFGAVANTLRVRVRYRIKADDSVYSDYTELSLTTNGNKYSATGTLTGLDYQRAYYVEIRVYDKIYGDFETDYEGYDAATCALEEAVCKTVTLKRGIPVFDWGENDFRVNKTLRTNEIQPYTVAFYPSANTNWDTAMLRLTGAVGDQHISVVTYKDGNILYYYDIVRSDNNTQFPRSVIAGGDVNAKGNVGFGLYSNAINYGLRTVWKDGNVYNLAERNADGLTAAFGWAGSSDYGTVTVLRGRTCKYQNSSGTTTLSDERLKKDFTALDKWEAFYDALEPCAFKLKGGNSGRYHMGFKAQQVEQALLGAGLTTQDFAGFIKTGYVADESDPEGSAVYAAAGIRPGDDEYGLIYNEFVALNTYKIQKLQAELHEVRQALQRLLDEKEETEHGET